MEATPTLQGQNLIDLLVGKGALSREDISKIKKGMDAEIGKLIVEMSSQSTEENGLRSQTRSAIQPRVQ